MKKRKPNVWLALAGCFLAGVGLFTGVALSSAIPNTPTLFGSVSSVYFAVSAAIVGGTMKRSQLLK